MFPARDGHRTAGSGDERTNQEATAPPHDHDDAIFTTRWVYVTFQCSPPLSGHVNMTDSSRLKFSFVRKTFYTHSMRYLKPGNFRNDCHQLKNKTIFKALKNRKRRFRRLT